MIPRLLIAAILVCSFSLSYAAEKSYGTFAIHPHPLKAGQTAEIKFVPEKSTLKSNGNAIHAIIFFYKKGKRTSMDVKLSEGKKRTGIFTIAAGTDAIAIKFMQGRDEDNNEGRGYYFEVSDEKGMEQTGTSYSVYRLYAGDYEAGFTKPNVDVAKRYLVQYMKQVDHKTISFVDLAGAFYMLNDTVNLRNHLDGLSKVEGLLENEFNTIGFYAKMAGSKYAPIIEQEIRRRFSEGNWKKRVWFDSTRLAKTAAEKLVWINAYKLANADEIKQNSGMLADLYYNLLSFSARNLDYETISYCIEQLKKLPAQPLRFVQSSLPFVAQVLEKDTLINETRPLALELLQISKARWDTSLAKPNADRSAYLQQFEAQRQYYSCANVYGGYLAQKGQYDSATYYTGLAAKFNNFKTTFYNDPYFKAAEKSSLSRQQLLTELETAFINEGYSVSMTKMYLAIYKAQTNTDGTARLEKIMFERKAKLREHLKTLMVNKDITAFQLPGLKGGTVSTESLKGKVVLIDFWATWCAPCVASFPTMQRLVDMNKENKDFVFLFVDVWQNEKDKYAVVNDFFKTRAFRFDVYMDLKDEVVKSFGVTGIPTKVILDKNGKLRFFSVGFNGDEEKGMEELQTMMELASEASI